LEAIENVYADVIADSIYNGHRLTTMEIQCHRFVLAEFNTHRDFSRNSASSRAIPFAKQLDRMEELGIAFPLEWRKEQKGMQGGDIIESEALVEQIENAWVWAGHQAVHAAKALHSAGVHKSIINRLLEPFMWHKIIVSATEWDNFFAQRCSPLAQPEIRVLAERMRDAYNASTPRAVNHDEWHTPYIDDLDIAKANDAELIRISAARCARVSYLTHDGVRDHAVDLDLYNKLVSADPPHWSPLEHVAVPSYPDEGRTSNFRGWTQLRHIVMDEQERNPKL
jgi:thymidylate synthase ThyX